MREMKKTFPVVAGDIFGYLADKYNGNNQINCILRLNGKIDAEILNMAVRLSLEIEPVLGCQYIERDNHAFWKACEDPGKLQLFSVVESDDVEDALQKFIGVRLNSAGACQLKVMLLRAETDTLGVKVNHASCDAGGLKQYISLLGSIYNQLFHYGRYNHKVVSNSRHGAEQIFCLPDIQNRIKKVKSRPRPGFAVSFPCDIGKDKDQAFATGKITPGETEALLDSSRKNGVSLNDVLLTAYNRAISKFAGLQDNRITVYLTIDLRRYLSENMVGGATNLSGGSTVTIECDPGKSFDYTLARV